MSDIVWSPIKLNLCELNPTSARAKILLKLGSLLPADCLARMDAGKMKRSLPFNLNACSVLNTDYLGC